MTDKIATKDGRYVVTSSEWDHNGSFRVIVADTRSTLADLRAVAYAPVPAAARRTARRVDQKGLTKWVRTDRITTAHYAGVERVAYQFTVSRLDRSYR